MDVIEWKPRSYMLKAVKFLLDRGSAALWLDPGLGKTSISLAAILSLLKARMMKSALVIAPLHVCYNSWPDEIQKWEQFSGLRFQILHGKDKLKALGTKADVYLVNPEGLPWLFETLSKLRGEWPFDVLFVDESSKFKHYNTQRFKLLKMFLGKFRRRYELTGSPAPNGLMDIWSQMYLLDEGKALGRFITHYRTRYFYQTGYGGYTWALTPGSDKKIYRALDGMVLRMEAKDWLDLPPLIINDIKITLPDKAFRQYRSMEDQLFTILDSGESATSPNAAAAGNKCLQIAGGGVYTDGAYDVAASQRAWETVHEAKMEALEDLIDGQEGEPLLVLYWFQHEMFRLQAKWPKAPIIGRGTTPKKAQEIIRAWNRGEVPYLFAQPGPISHGLNMQGTHAALCFFSMLWDLEAYDQAIRRVYRQGQKQRVMVHRLIARNTIDEDVVTTLKGKERTQNRLTAAIKDRAAKLGYV